MTLTFPKIIGHRGARALAPENTLDGLRTAAAQGVRYVEFDAKLTRDGIVILMHDEMLDRTTDGTGAVADTDYATIARLDAGSKLGSQYGRQFAPARVPTLVETIAELERLGMGANIEIKPCPGREAETAVAVCDIVRQHWPSSLPTPLLSSFATESLAAAQAHAPELPRGYLAEKLPADWRSWSDRLACATINLGQEQLTPADIEAVRAAGLPLLVWTVNDPERATALLAAGVAAIITDMPDRVRA